MLVYLDNTLGDRERSGGEIEAVLREAIMEDAVLRVRPKVMAVAVIVAGLIPIFLSEDTVSELMSRIAAPMIGGMIIAPLLSIILHLLE